VFLEPLQRLAIFESDPVPRLRCAEGAEEEAGAPRMAPVALHPGSGSERKNWPEARWPELMERLLREGRELLLVGGEAEGDRLQRLRAQFPGAPVQEAFRCPLVELAVRLPRCALLVGHDSGISHLAAAVGIPVLALWGETLEAVWRPRGERVQLLHGGAGLAGLEVGAVWKEIQRMLG
jgi:heptosyltransferase-2